MTIKSADAFPSKPLDTMLAILRDQLWLFQSSGEKRLAPAVCIPDNLQFIFHAISRWTEDLLWSILAGLSMQRAPLESNCISVSNSGWRDMKEQ